MEKEIEEIIKKNLPAQVGETLQKELARIPVLEDMLQKLNASYNELVVLYKNSQVEIAEWREKSSRLSALDSFNESLLKRERELDVTLLKAELENAKKMNDNQFSILSGLVRNTEFRKDFSGMVVTPISGGGNSCGYASRETINQTTIEKQE